MLERDAMASQNLVPLFKEVWAKLEELCAALTEDEWDTPTDLPGWTVKDCLAHIVGTEAFLAGRPMPPALEIYPDYVHNDIGKVNENFLATMRDMSGPEVLDAFREITSERLGQLEAMTVADWEKPSWTPRGQQSTYVDFMEVRIFDTYTHEQDIRRAIGCPGHFDGPVVDLARDEIRRTLPYIVGKKAAAPQGATVVFDVTGPDGVTLAIGVDGRAGYLDEMPIDPDVTLRADFLTFHAVSGGRHGGCIEIEGDQDLGRRIIENLNFVI